MGKRIFLLSPANTGGQRARLLFGERAGFDLAVRLREDAATLGEIYSFVSGLYFRGKAAYAAAFHCPPADSPGAFVITPGRGLLPLETRVTLEELREIAMVSIELGNPRYREPLEADLCVLEKTAGPDCEVVLLGSIATPKYVEPLLSRFGERLLFPSEFVGRGDMSRGGLMLRCVDAGSELTYMRVDQAVRRGPRPPKLPKRYVPGK